MRLVVEPVDFEGLGRHEAGDAILFPLWLVGEDGESMESSTLNLN